MAAEIAVPVIQPGIWRSFQDGSSRALNTHSKKGAPFHQTQESLGPRRVWLKSAGWRVGDNINA